MEFPQGHAFGSASCGYGGNYQDFERLPDMKCEGNVNTDGQRLGSTSIMAVYRAVSLEELTQPRIVRLPVTLDGVRRAVNVETPSLTMSNVDTCFDQHTAVMEWCASVNLDFNDCQTIMEYVKRGLDVEFGQLLPKWMPKPCDDDRALRECLVSVAKRSEIVQSRVLGNDKDSNLLVTKSEIELVTTKTKTWISKNETTTTQAAFQLFVKQNGTSETSVKLMLDVTSDAALSLLNMCGKHDVSVESCLSIYESAERFRKQSLYDALVDALSLTLQDDFFFVQIGAHVGNTWNDPIYHRLMKPIPDVDIPHRKNWRGILVEPVPHLFRKLQENYANVPKGQLLFENSAICDRTGPGHTFYSITERVQQAVKSYCEEEGNQCLLSGTAQIISQIGSLDREHLEEHFKRFLGENVDASGMIQDGKIEINCLSYHDLLRKHGRRRADWVLIDAEGHDDEIIQAILSSPDSDTLPYIIAFEHVHIVEKNRGVFSMLRNRGYYCVHLQSMDTFCQRRGGDEDGVYGGVLRAMGCVVISYE
eukprot:g4802.t1